MSKQDEYFIPKKEAWRFRTYTIYIREMDISQVLHAMLHSFKRMNHFSKKKHYADYQINIAANKEQIEIYKGKKEYYEKWMFYYAEKVEYLENRAHKLGYEVPEKMENIRKAIDNLEGD